MTSIFSAPNIAIDGSIFLLKLFAVVITGCNKHAMYNFKILALISRARGSKG
jgi:hypothetical protein